MEQQTLASWIGRKQVSHERIGPWRAIALNQTLGYASEATFESGQEISPLWNWIYFLDTEHRSRIGVDGHPERGGFLPPVTLPRRMWAGSRCAFHAPIRIGTDAVKTSTVKSVEKKTGRSGDMVFVTVAHEISCNGELCLTEEQDIVYINIPDTYRSPAGTPLPQTDWSEYFVIDPVVLFRFSALTFNGHRIHYDRPYAQSVEHYPGLVVHGPLQAILLFDTARRRTPERRPRAFSFRGVGALFDDDQLSLSGKDIDATTTELFSVKQGRDVTMRAKLEWTSS